MGFLVTGFTRRLLDFARRPELLAFLPGATLMAFWLGGEGWLVIVALTVPVIYLLAGLRGGTPGDTPARSRDHPAMRDELVARLEAVLDGIAGDGRRTACLVIGIDDAAALRERHGQSAWETLLTRTGERLGGALRDNDRLARLEGDRFAVALAPDPRIDLEAALQIARRLQNVAEAPISVDAMTVYLTVSVGLCLSSRAPAPGGAALLGAAEIAHDEARRHGPAALRAFTPEMRTARAGRAALDERLAEGLESGEIRAWFQPQICTDTGRISGFEALARWVHPERGLIPPADFLPLVDDAGLSARLGEAMRAEAFRALRAWDDAGCDIGRVSVNASTEELRDPRLPEMLEWELDRFELAPERLAVEILESVAAGTDDDTIVQNIARIARMGCLIDLDDFGTGHASIANIRRFAVRRLKIDRSFVANLHEDREQQRLVAAILSMAEELGLETIGEGVETPGEHAILAQLGCGHVQGFGIARPMPLRDTHDWIARHHARMAAPAALHRRFS